MTSPGRVGWKAVRVLAAGPSPDASPQAGPERLAALYRFQSVGRSPGHAFFVTADGKRDLEIDRPDQVDWTGFPVIAALEAVTYDELRRLRLLLTESGEYEKTSRLCPGVRIASADAAARPRPWRRSPSRGDPERPLTR